MAYGKKDDFLVSMQTVPWLAINKYFKCMEKRRKETSQFQNFICSNYKAVNFSPTSLILRNMNPLKLRDQLCACVLVHDYQRLPLKAFEKYFSKIQEEDGIKSLEKIIIFSFGECISYVWVRNLLPCPPSLPFLSVTCQVYSYISIFPHWFSQSLGGGGGINKKVRK